MAASVTPADRPIVDVTDQDFEAAVIDRSRTVPVVVDFWAPWCGPCRVLGPTLERLATEMRGAFVLAKVNVDQNPALSRRFNVRSIPMVQGFRDGAVADGFTGALPESRVRDWLRKLIPSDTDALAAEADRLASTDPDGAIARYRSVLDRDPAHAASLLGLGRLLLLRADPDATSVLRRIPAGTPAYPRAQALLELAELLEPGEAGASEVPESGYAAAAAHARAGRWEQALQHLLDVVQRTRFASHGEDGERARRAMLSIFAFLGDADPLTQRYRRMLANALF